MHDRSYSGPWVKAWRDNAQQEVYNTIQLRKVAPTGSGVVDLGGGSGPSRVLVMPFCEGAPGAVFSMRLYGWRPLGNPQSTGGQVWIWNVLAEFVCVAGAIQGPYVRPEAVAYNILTSTENLCDGLALSRGVLGLTGFINSNGPGSGIPACAAVELYGCGVLSFDFAQGGSHAYGGVLGMNCLYAML